MCCDMQLVSVLTDDVEKRKTELRNNLLELKAAAFLQKNAFPLALNRITLTVEEKQHYSKQALQEVTCRLPEETKAEYKRAIKQEQARRKVLRRAGNTTIEKPKTPLEEAYFELYMHEAKENAFNEMIRLGFIEISPEGDVIIA